ncbi:hypothetical protein FHS57_005096 [Runella defluvii]|uniref:Uncharacterized protein n=1 Tax=Runella defluvii TaxID=370973 RepID=A0A7W5ZQT3_9BACT|nr:hypothetical protein [Runella defluvii]MBB3841075.1 hypothetical protein [Runella defluvii]
MKSISLTVVLLLYLQVTYAQYIGTQYRFINTKSGFEISCPNSLDLCFLKYNNGSEFLIDFQGRKSFSPEYDNGRKLLGKYYFNDEYSGYYVRQRDNKRLNFRVAQESDFEDLISDKQIGDHLIGERVKNWIFAKKEEYLKITRISNDGLNRKLGFHLKDYKSGKQYYLIVEVTYQFNHSFRLNKIQQISYTSI